MGVTDVYAKITPATERARLEKIMNIKLGGSSATRRGNAFHRQTTKLGSSTKNRASMFNRKEHLKSPMAPSSNNRRGEIKTPSASKQ